MGVKYHPQFGYLNPMPILPRNKFFLCTQVSIWSLVFLGSAGRNIPSRFWIGISGRQNFRVLLESEYSDLAVFSTKLEESGWRGISTLFPPLAPSKPLRRRLQSPASPGRFPPSILLGIGWIWSSSSLGFFSTKLFPPWMRVSLFFLNPRCFSPYLVESYFLSCKS